MSDNLAISIDFSAHTIQYAHSDSKWKENRLRMLFYALQDAASKLNAINKIIIQMSGGCVHDNHHI